MVTYFLLFGIIAIVFTIISFIKKKTLDIAGTMTQTPLMNAAVDGDIEVMKELLSSGVDIDETNTVKNTALSLAVIHQKEESTKLLIEAGADLKMWYRDNKNIFQLAIEGENENILSQLIEKANFELLIENNLFAKATKSDFSSVVLKQLLEKDKEGEYFKIREGNHYSDIDWALWLASLNGNVKNVEFLLNNGAKMTTNPIKAAVESGSITLVKLFIEKGEDVESKDEDSGATCLVIAVQKGHLQVAEFLLKNKANPNIQFKDPQTKLPTSLLSYVNWSTDHLNDGHLFLSLLKEYGARKKI